jgi:hypothetical protein
MGKKLMKLIRVSKLSLSKIFSTNGTAKENTVKIKESKTVDEQSIKKTINKYFDTKYLMMANLKLNNKVGRYFDKNDTRAEKNLEFENKLLEVQIEARSAQNCNLKFHKYSYSIDYTTVKISDNEATIVLKESQDIYFKCTPQVKSQMIGKQHTIDLKKNGSRWCIISDEYFDEHREMFKAYNKQEKSLEKAKELMVRQNIETARCIKSVRNSQNIKGLKDSVEAKAIRRAAKNTYNRDNAVLYAQTWALKLNTPPWANYESRVAGGDCTNFISQCLYNGGIPFDTTGASDYVKWYWYSEGKRVAPWSGAKEFNYYVKHNTSGPGLRAHFGSWSDMNIGDIVQLGGFYPKTTHSMIITGYVRDDYGEIIDYLICQHSTIPDGRMRDYPLSAKSTIDRVYIVIDGFN